MEANELPRTTNGQSEVISASAGTPDALDVLPATNLYPVDAARRAAEVEVKNGERHAILVHYFKPPSGLAYRTREKAVQSETEQIGKGRERARFSDEQANELFHAENCTGGELRPTFGGAARELSKEEMQALTTEQKSAGVRRLLECAVKVRAGGGGDYDFLFEGTSEIVADLFIPDADPPAYTITLRLRAPDKARRWSFREGFISIETVRGGDKPRNRVITNLLAAEQFFREHFTHVSGVSLKGAAYQDTDRDEFLRLFDTHYMAEVAAAVVAYYTTAAGN